MSNYLCSSCNEDGMVCIPRDQYDTLVAAAKAWAYYFDVSRTCGEERGERALATLRAAGVEEGK